MAQHRATAPSRRVAIVATDAGELLRLRLPLLETAVGSGHKLLCLTSSAGKADLPRLRALGAEHAAFPMNGRTLKPIGDRASVTALRTALKAWQPNSVLAIGLKPMLLTAQSVPGIPDVRTVLLASSLDGFRGGWLTRRALKGAETIVAHNGEDAARLAEARVLPAMARVHVLPGAGVDLSHYVATPLPDLGRGLVFTMISPPLREKGVIEFCEAARRVKQKAPSARFVLALVSADEGQIPIADLRRYDDAVDVTTSPDDARPLIAAAHVVVQPSYEEGIAHRVVEALACGRPAITTNVAGCRETVDERVSGVLVPPRDAIALAAAMESFLRRPDLIPWMAQASRHKAERRFDAREINAQLLRLMGLGHDGGS